MKAIKLTDWQQKNKKPEQWVIVKPCLICGTTKEGYYARYGDSGVCSRDCMQRKDNQCSAVPVLNPSSDLTSQPLNKENDRTIIHNVNLSIITLIHERNIMLLRRKLEQVNLHQQVKDKMEELKCDFITLCRISYCYNFGCAVPDLTQEQINWVQHGIVPKYVSTWLESL